MKSYILKSRMYRRLIILQNLTPNSFSNRKELLKIVQQDVKKFFTLNGILKPVRSVLWNIKAIHDGILSHIIMEYQAIMRSIEFFNYFGN